MSAAPGHVGMVSNICHSCFGGENSKLWVGNYHLGPCSVLPRILLRAYATALDLQAEEKSRPGWGGQGPA